MNLMQASVSSADIAKVDERIRQMKSYHNLWEKILSEKNIELAISKSCKDKSNKRKIKHIKSLKENPDRISIVRNWIINYKTTKHRPTEIYDGIKRKIRLIYVPSVRETVVQHAVVQVLNECLGKSFYEHSYAAIRGKGQHLAKKRIEKWIKRDVGKVKYYFKMDIKKYFPSVSQEILLKKLKRQIKDWRTIDLVTKILAVVDDGIPLGFYISQWLANYYLTDFDHAVVEHCKDIYYVRWMDDIVVFCGNKRRLRKYAEFIIEELHRHRLMVKPTWRLVRFAYGEKAKEKSCKGCFLDFMGFRFYRNRTTLRKNLFYRMCRKARRISKKEKPSVFELRQFLSYLGWIKSADVYNAYKEFVKPYVNIQYLKRRISRYDRRLNYGMA